MGLAACGGSDGPTASQRALEAAGGGTIKPEAVPPTVLGLASSPEDVGHALKEAGENAFVTDVRLWSLREGERLRATLQVARFAPDAPATEEQFRRTVAGNVGGSVPKLRRVEDDIVYVSAGNRQVFYMWFRGIHFVLLTVPGDTANGRSLLRAALKEVNP